MFDFVRAVEWLDNKYTSLNVQIEWVGKNIKPIFNEAEEK